MFLRKWVLERWSEDVKREAAAYKALLAAKDLEIVKLEGRLERMAQTARAGNARLLELEREVGDERAAGAAAKVYSDLHRVRVNHLERQNGDLLARCLAGYSVPAPQIVTDPVMPPPGIDFEDMGDVMAAKMGYAPEHPATAEPLGQEMVTPTRDPVDGLERTAQPVSLDDMDAEERAAWNS